MSSRVITTAYGREALVALRSAVTEAKRSDLMSPVTIVVPNNIAGVIARRYLAYGLEGRGPGVAGIHVTTLPRLAEQIASPLLYPLRPATRPLIGAAWRAALGDDAGVFADVADHPATVRALTEAHRELRDLSESALSDMEAATTITPDLVRLHRTVSDQISRGWYDATDLLNTAAAHVRTGAGVPELGAVILCQPQDLNRAEVAFATALGELTDLTVVASLTGVGRADGALRKTLDRLDLDISGRHVAPPTATRVLTASDSDDETRCVVREVVKALETTPAHRVAILYPATSPYARLLREHLEASGIKVNGPGSRTVSERAVSRTLTEILALEDRDLPRADVFRALANAPTYDFTGTRIPISRWERMSRDAGVVSGDDWDNRLGRLIGFKHAAIEQQQAATDPEQWITDRARADIETATALRDFATELRRRLRSATELTTWHELAAWCLDLFRILVIRGDALMTLPVEEQYAAAAVELTLEGLGTLDSFGQPTSLQALRDMLDVELGSSLPRVGRFGDGVLVAPISTAIGLDVDVVYVVGLSEDLYPGRSHEDALLPDRARGCTHDELPQYRERLHRKHRHLLAAFAAGSQYCVASFPRGDLRRSSQRLPSRWLLPTLRELAHDTRLPATAWQAADYDGAMTTSGSFAGTLETTSLFASEQEWRVRAASSHDRLDDPVVDRAIEMVRARAGSAFTRFDGNLTDAAGLPNYADNAQPISPTALESFAVCPHAFFVRRLLGVTPLEQPEEVVTISPADIGTLVHESLDQLVHEFATCLPTFGQAWTGRQRARLIAIAHEKATGFEERGLTGHPRLWTREMVRILSDLARLLDDDDTWRSERMARVVASELTFGMHGNPPVEIAIPSGRILMRGSADKVDLGNDGTIFVTDVKTGSARSFQDISRDNPVVGGTKLQLPVYAYAARDRYGDGDTAVQAMYWFVRKDRGRIEVPLTPDVEAVYVSTLDTIVTSIAAGLFPQHAPEKPDWTWVQCQYCNPDGIGHSDSRARWERQRLDAALAGYVRLVEPESLAADGSEQ